MHSLLSHCPLTRAARTLASRAYVNAYCLMSPIKRPPPRRLHYSGPQYISPLIYAGSPYKPYNVFRRGRRCTRSPDNCEKRTIKTPMFLAFGKSLLLNEVFIVLEYKVNPVSLRIINSYIIYFLIFSSELLLNFCSVQSLL